MSQKSVREMVSNYLKKEGLSQFELAKKGNLSCTSVVAALRGHYDRDLSKVSNFKKVGSAGTISRLAIACGEDPKARLQSLGLEDLGTAALTRKTRIASIEQGMDIQITQDDLDYLSIVIKGLKQPLTVRVAVELLKLRSTN